jgi:hypothetical protein
MTISSRLGDIALIARTDGFRHMGDSFRDGSAWRNVSQLLVLLVIIAALVAIPWALSVVAKAAERRANRSPRRLFRELCRNHHISASGRRLLWRIARGHPIDHPASVFLMPECFDTANVPPALASHGPEIAALRTRLFGASE